MSINNVSDFNAVVANGYVPTQSSAPAANAIPTAKPDEFAAQAEPKKEKVGGIFGNIASVFMKTGVTIKEGTNGIVKGATQGLLLGGVAYGVGSLIEGGVKVGKGELKGGDFIFAPFKAIARGAASLKDVAFSAWDTRIGDALTGMVKTPFKFVANFMSPTYVSRETKNAAFAAREAARVDVKGFFARAKAGRTAFKEIMKNPDNLIAKVGGMKTRYVALAVGAAVLVYNIVGSKLNINQARHEVDEKFIKTPITGTNGKV